jgi:hypothetical protein
LAKSEAVYVVVKTISSILTLQDIALALDILTKLVILVEQNSAALPYPVLLGIDARARRPLEAFRERLDESVSTVSQALDALREERRRLEGRT